MAQSSRTVAILAALAAAAGIGAWLLLSGGAPGGGAGTGEGSPGGAGRSDAAGDRPDATDASRAGPPVPVGAVLGKVTGGGAPLAGAEVLVERLALATEGDEGPWTAVTGADGAFRVPLPAASPLRVTLRARGWRSLVLPEPLGEIRGDHDLGTFDLVRALPVTGRVLDPSGKPLGGAEVRAVADSVDMTSMNIRTMVEQVFAPPAVLDRATTREDGTFLLESLGKGTYVLVASHPKYAPNRRDGVLVDPTGETPPVEIVLVPGHSLRVRCLDSAGAPIPGVELSLIPSRMRMPDGTDQHLGKSDARGDAVFDNLAGGSLIVAARTTTRPTAWREAVVPRDPVVEFRMGGTCGLLVRVRDGADAPVEGADVMAFFEGAGGGVATAKTGPDGTVLWKDLAPGRLMLASASKEGWTPASSLGLRGLMGGGGGREELKAGQTLEKVLTLGRGAVVTGTVRRRPEGAAVAGAKVRLVAPALFMLGAGSSTVTDEKGVYRFEGVPEGPSLLTVVADGSASAAAGGMGALMAAFGGGGDSEISVQVPAGATEVTKDLWVEPTGGVAGRVIGPEGTAVSGAKVTVRPKEEGFMGRMGPFGGDPLGLAPSPVLTAADGTFRVAGVGAGENLVAEAQHPAFVDATSAPFTLAQGGSQEGVEVALGAGALLQGRVTAKDGSPVSGAMVRAIGREGAAGGMFGRGAPPEWAFRSATPAFTDAEGTYTLKGIPPGKAAVRAEMAGFVPSVQDGVAATAGATATADFVLSPGLTITGFVRDAQGGPVEGARVSASAPGDRGGGGGFAGGSSMAVTGSDGAFKLQDLAEGLFDIDVRPRAHPQERVAGIQAGASGIVVTVQAAVSLRGRVEDESGAPVAEAFVNASLEGSSGRSGAGGSRTGADGVFSIENLAAGTYTLSTWGPDGFASSQQTGVVAGGGEVVLVVKKALSISGKVTDADGKPPAVGGFLSVTTPDGKPAPGGAGWAPKDGTFQIRDLPPGKYTVRARTFANPPLEATGTAQAGDTDLVIALPAQ
jgi:protocatechuate 3,4-dioxygenase beta subunit